MTTPNERKDTIAGRMGRAERLVTQQIAVQVEPPSCLQFSLKFSEKVPTETQITAKARQLAIRYLRERPDALRVTIFANSPEPEGKDRYLAIAALMFQVPEAEVTAEMRSRAKTAALMITMGGSDG